MEGNSRHDNSNARAVVGPSKYAREYDMNHGRRGKAIIFSHYEFMDDSIEKREGNNVDEDRLFHELSELDFEVLVKRDRTMNGIMRELKTVAKEDHSDADCLVVVIMSHGRESKKDENKKENQKPKSKSGSTNYEILAMDKHYNELDLFVEFNGKDCPTLRGKPKLFFIQACRGSEKQSMVQLQSFRRQGDGSSNEHALYWIPDVADFLVVRATFDGTAAIRNEVEGTVFIQTLCDVLRYNREENNNKDDLNTLLLFVNGRVAVQGQMPFVVHTLTRLIYFKPKPSVYDKRRTDECEID